MGLMNHMLVAKLFRMGPPRCGILSAGHFRRLLVRERNRCDRNGGCFSVLAFDLGRIPYGGSAAVFNRIVTESKTRTRCTDEIGIFDAGRVGIFLSDTGPAGADRVARDLCTRMNLPQAAYLIYTYAPRARRTREEAALPDAASQPAAAAARIAREEEASAEPLSGAAAARTLARSAHAGAASQRGSVQVLDPPGTAHGSRAEAEARPAAGGSAVAATQAATARLPALLAQPPAFGLEWYFIHSMPLWKRAIDVAGAALLLMLFSPLMLAAALAITLTSPGPIIFRQQRVGKGGKPFTFYKFRSMINGADAQKKALRFRNEKEGPIFKIRNDPRITLVGRILRKTSIDELPQLWNVLKGDMSLVGPRPPTVDEVPEYDPWQRRRLDLTGGLTCLWQVSGRSCIGFEDWMRLDMKYVERRSFLLDLKLLFKTPFEVIRGRGAH